MIHIERKGTLPQAKGAKMYAVKNKVKNLYVITKVIRVKSNDFVTHYRTKNETWSIYKTDAQTFTAEYVWIIAHNLKAEVKEF